MNSKQRVNSTLTFNEPDHVPCGFYAIDNDTVERIIGRPTLVRSKAKTKIALWEGRRDEVVSSFVRDSIELFHKLEDVIDIINLQTELYPLVPAGLSKDDSPKKISDDTWEDRFGNIYRYSPITDDITIIHRQDELADGIQGLSPFGQNEEDESMYVAVDAITKEFKENKFIIGPFPCAKELILLGGFERGLEIMALEPEIVEKEVETTILQSKALQKSWKNRGFDALLEGEDFSFNQGCFISPQMFRKFCFPQIAANASFAHSHNLPFFHHACGNNWSLLDSFLEAGVDCYQSVQESAGMNLAEVKKQLHGDMSIWGGVGLEYLVTGNVEEVREQVRRALDIGAPGGGYIFGTSHSIAFGCKYENVMAMFEEFVKRR